MASFIVSSLDTIVLSGMAAFIGGGIGHALLDSLDVEKASGCELKKRQTERLETIRKVYQQQREMYEKNTHSVPDRIVSISQPYIRPIVRGKAAAPVEQTLITFLEDQASG